MKCITDEFLNNLMNTVNAAVHIKDAVTGKYLNSNAKNSKTFCLQPSDIIGLTVNDLDSMMVGFWDPNFIAEIVQLEQKIVQYKSCMSHKQSFLTKENKIRVQNLVKLPIYSTKNVEQIFTISEDIVASLSLEQLWQLHKESNSSDIKVKIKNFLTQTSVITLFHDLPTEAELSVIIANVMYKQPGSKYVAQALNISPRTVEVHNMHISEKIKCRFLI